MSFKVKTGKRVVLVGTYRAGQLERWPGYYNYPLNAGDAVDAGAAKRVEYLGLWDTVDATPGLAVAEDCPANVRFARHAVAEHEARRFYAYVPLRGGQVEEALFPGVHSDVGGLYEDDHALADAARAWVAASAAARGLRFRAGTDFSATRAPATAKRHDSLRLVSNLFGLLRPARRLFPKALKRPDAKGTRATDVVKSAGKCGQPPTGAWKP